MKRIILLIFSFILFACDGESTGENTSMHFDVPLNHPNGLIVNRPTGFEESSTSDGFRFAVSGASRMRNPPSISVKRQDTAPDVQRLTSKRLGGDRAFYRISISAAGSGGTEYDFWAIKPSGNHWIVVQAWEQHELVSPSFRLAWMLLEQAQLQHE